MTRGKQRKNATQKMRNWNGLRRRSGVPRRQISLTCVQIMRSKYALQEENRNL